MPNVSELEITTSFFYKNINQMKFGVGPLIQLCKIQNAMFIVF